VGVGIAIAQESPSGHSTPAAAPSDPGISWPAGARPAPNFVLRGENGAAVDLRSFRGRPVIVAFIDPVCRNLCPLEARVLNDVPAALPTAARPAILAVSVNPWNQSRSDLRLDAQKWRLTPSWRWALGGYSQLARVWKRYAISVQVRTKRLAGVTVHEVDHTEAAYVIDAAGDERAVFVFPYRTEDVVKILRRLTSRSSSSQR
jgi:cytochrome oxidase Cu insertion factor (SCO1/SenC/PrrC family)